MRCPSMRRPGRLSAAVPSGNLAAVPAIALVWFNMNFVLKPVPHMLSLVMAGTTASPEQ